MKQFIITSTSLLKNEVLKIPLVMKISLVLLIVSALQINANVFSQSSLKSFSFKNTYLRDALKEIEENTDYRFFYSDDLFNVNETVSSSIENKNISEAMGILLENSEVTYEILDNNLIILTAKEQKDNKQVSGKVVDAFTGEPLVGVNIVIKGSNTGVSTDLKGKFNILLSGNDSIILVSYVGYVGQILQPNDEKAIVVMLMPDVKKLDEVVVVGYGTQRKKDVTGAISVVSSEAIKDRPVVQFGSALQGKTAGVQIITSSGTAQNSFFMRIRGNSSILASSEPLYIIDGIPTQNMYALNPNDIETFSILKDASASAIYGANGANGVVLITTKKGKDKKAKVEMSSYFGVSQISKKLDVLNATQYKDLMTEMGFNADWAQYKYNTNWQDEIYRTAFMQSHQASISAATENTNYYISANYMKQDGIIRSNTADRYSLKINIDQKISENIKVGSNITYTRWHDVEISQGLGSGRGGVVMSAITSAPNIGIYNTDGTFTGNPLMPSFENPVASTDGPKKNYFDYRFLGNLYVEIGLLKNLRFRSMFGIDNDNSKNEYYLDPFKTDWGRTNKGIADASSALNEYWISENTLTFKKALDQHSIELVGGSVASKKYSSSMGFGTKQFSSNAITSAKGSIISYASEDRSEMFNTSVLARANYAYADKYLFTSNYRADASSVFGPDYKWGYFPSFSIGWRVSQEQFMKDLDIFDEFKFRFGWGKVGNASIRAYSWIGKVSSGGDYVIGNNVLSGTLPNTLENSSLRWEATSQTNIGADIAVLNSKILFTFDAYIKTTKDLLYNKPIATSSGYTSATQNVGSLENRGIEFQIETENIKSRFEWNTSFNITFNRNKVLDIKKTPMYDGDIYQRGNVSVAIEGEPLGLLWGYISEGVDSQTGMVKYKDLDGVVGITDADKAIIGSAEPSFTYGLNNTFKYAGLELSIFFMGVQGNDLFNSTRLEGETMTDYRNQLASVSERWKTIGQITNIPKVTPGDKNNSELSSRFIEDGSYLRLKTLTLSYTLPKEMLANFNINGLKFYVTGENLLTFTKYTGYDPEVSTFGGSNLAQGVDYGMCPQPKKFIFGLNLTF